MHHADQLATNLGAHLDVLLKRPLAGWNCDSKWFWACLDQLVHVASFGQNCEDTAVLCHVAWRWPRRTTLYLFSSSVLSAGLLHEFGMDSALCHFDVLSRIHRWCKSGRRQQNRLGSIVLGSLQGLRCSQGPIHIHLVRCSGTADLSRCYLPWGLKASLLKDNFSPLCCVMVAAFGGTTRNGYTWPRARILL